MRLFWISAAAGWALIAWGIRGALEHRVDTRPAELLRFVVGGAVAHDLILAPLVLALGFVIARVAPRRVRAAVQAVLIVAGCVGLFAWPEVRDYAHVLHNPSSLPHNYTANMLAVIGVVMAVGAIGVLARRPR